MKFTYSNGDRPLDGFTIKRGVGIGGFGEVYFATSDAGKEVALKRIQRNLDIEVRGVTQCLNLKHPHLIDLYDIRYDDHGEGWIIMEYVAGDSLKDVIDRNPNGLPLEEVMRWFRGIAAGVAYLHDHGIVHRDLKPGNVFVDGDVVKIGDYGLSKFISCSRRSGQTESVGTFHYMAPEIGKGNYGKEIDVYALGIILFELLTGRVPFEGESSQEIIMKHLTAEPPLAGIAQPYRRVIERALFKDPEKRFASVEGMLEALGLGGPTGTPSAGAAATTRPTVPPAAAPPQPLLIIDEHSDAIVFGPVIELAPVPPVVTPPILATAHHEPIARAAWDAVHRATLWWQRANLTTPMRVLILLGVVFLMLQNLEWLVPVASVLLTIYLVYFGVRVVLLAMNGPVRATNTPPVRQAAYVSPVRNTRKVRWTLAARQLLQQKAASERCAELTGSMILAAIVSAVLCLAMMLITGHSLDGSVQIWSLFAWVTLGSALASWGILACGKAWETNDGDAVRRRFALLAVGLGVGLLAFLGAQSLMIDFGASGQFSEPLIGDLYPRSMFGSRGQPQLPAYMTFFGGLFLVLRWWKQADPLRRTRLSLWPAALAVLWSLLLPLPQPWGVILAATTSIAVQLSAPWMNNHDRSLIRQQVMEV